MNSLERILGSFLAVGGMTGCQYEYSIVGQIVHDNGEEKTIVVPQDTSENTQDTQSQEDTGVVQNYCLWVDSFVQPKESNGTDIIWVIDKSGSMGDDEARVLAGIEAMMNTLPSTDWRLNMITTDIIGVRQDQLFPLVPGDTVSDAQDMYNAISGMSSSEQGLEALKTYVDENTYASTWLRPDALFLAVFVSDEEDQSFYWNSDADAIAEFETWFDSFRDYNHVASIVHFPPNTSLCNSSEDLAGDRYLTVAQDYNGTTIDICSEDWSAGVQDASEQVKPYEFWRLTYQPIPDSLRIFENGLPVPEYDPNTNTGHWQYDQSTHQINFLIVPPGDTLVEIAYEIDVNTDEDCPSLSLDTGDTGQ